MKNILSLSIAASLLLCISTTSEAALITFFGEDFGGGRSNSDIAQADFLTHLANKGLTTIGTENFENSTVGAQAPLSLTFPAVSDATLNGQYGRVRDNANGGRWATSGTNYWAAATGDFSIDFSNPISAFGFYGTDIGDWGGALTLLLNFSNGTSHTLNVGNTLGSNSSTNGSLLYFGFYSENSNDIITSISFLNDKDPNDPDNDDAFGFDDMTIARHNPVPEPSTLLLFTAGLAGLAARARRK